MVHQLRNSNNYEYKHSTTDSKGRQRLSEFFLPGCYDVICARGKKGKFHEGNQRFRGLVRLYQESYRETTCKCEKSEIVSKIVNTIRQHSPEGGFVKFIDGIWYEVGDRAAKEKVGQTFRDLLHTKYSSSTKAKAKVRIQRRVEDYKASGVLPKDVSIRQPHYSQISTTSRTEHTDCNATIVSEDLEERDGDEQRAVTGSIFDNIDTFDLYLHGNPEGQQSINMPPLSIGNDQLLGAELTFDCASLADEMDDLFAL